MELGRVAFGCDIVVMHVCVRRLHVPLASHFIMLREISPAETRASERPENSKSQVLRKILFKPAAAHAENTQVVSST